MEPFLMRSDVEALKRDRSPTMRAQTADKVSRAFMSGGLSDTERSIAEDIVRILLADAEVLVRKSLASILSEFPDLPRDIARALAFDEIDVATPILMDSMALTDDDLIEIIHRCSGDHSLAIARRPYVSPVVSTELVVRNDEKIVSTLLHNRHAVLDEAAQHLIINTLGHAPRIMDMLAIRAALPITVVERLITRVSESVRGQLVSDFRVSRRHLDLLLLHAREHLLLTTMVDNAIPGDVRRLVEQIREDGRLTPTLLLRGLCLGDMDFVRMATSAMAGIPEDNAMRLLSDRGRAGAEQLYGQCGLPDSLRPVFQAVMSLVRRHQYAGEKRERALFRNSVYSWGLSYLGMNGQVLGHDQLITRVLMMRPERATGRRGRAKKV